jgi:hypothetical protein
VFAPCRCEHCQLQFRGTWYLCLHGCPPGPEGALGTTFPSIPTKWRTQCAKTFAHHTYYGVYIYC